VPAVLGRSLVRYDLLILWKGARAAFSGTRDRLLLLLAVPLLGAMAVQGAAGVSAALGEAPASVQWLLAILAGFAPNLIIGRRLDHLREHSVVAAAALRRDAGAVYALFWNVPPFALAMAFLVGGAGSVPDAAGLAPPLLLAYGGGIVAALLSRRAGEALGREVRRRQLERGAGRRMRLSAASRRRRIADLAAGRTGLPRLALAANLLAFAALGALGAGGYALLRVHAAPGWAAGIAAGALVIAVTLLMRQQAALLRYLLFVGDGPERTALVPAALAAAMACGAVAAAALTGAGDLSEVAAVSALGVILLAAFLLLRGLHHAARPRRAADFAIQIDAVALVAAGIAVPWLAAPLLAGRLFLLHRRARALRHVAP
jgi:hypothetical protein